MLLVAMQMPVERDDDWGLLDRVTREPEALAALFERHRDFVYRLAYARLRHQADAEDLTQDVFYQLSRGGRRFFRGAQFRTWLYRVTANKIADRLRKSRGRSESAAALENLHSTQPGPDAGGDLGRLLDGLTQLPRRQQEVVSLRLLEEFSTEETAAALRISAGSVKTHLHRATQRLRELLTQTGTTDQE